VNTPDHTAEPALDAHQLLRIEAVHRGFLYQHLYAVGCLLLAQRSGVETIIIERDEDIELVLPCRRIYIQVKTRSAPLIASDIASALQRFGTLRLEHTTGKRKGEATFIIVANVKPGPTLLKSTEGEDWPKDVTIQWPANSPLAEKTIPIPQPDIAAALTQCVTVAAGLPHARLSSETLVWKLAGAVMAAAAGLPKYVDHSF
jgi:hypothetical protein